MKSKLAMNPEGTLFILTKQPTIKQKPIETPFGTAMRINSHKILKPQQPSKIGSEAYRASLSRAFNRAKQQIYFNPDMTRLVTLTYAENMQDIDKLLSDVRNLIRSKHKPGISKKYLFTVEKQERGALHIHMICTDFLITHRNKNGYESVTNWGHGFSSALNIQNTDENFKPYLYLFKYMTKAQRIGKQFIYASKNLNNFTELTDYEFNRKLMKLSFSENVQMGYLDRRISRKYYKKP